MCQYVEIDVVSVDYERENNLVHLILAYMYHNLSLLEALLLNLRVGNLAGVKLWGDLGEIVALGAKMSPKIGLRESLPKKKNFFFFFFFRIFI